MIERMVFERVANTRTIRMIGYERASKLADGSFYWSVVDIHEQDLSVASLPAVARRWAHLVEEGDVWTQWGHFSFEIMVPDGLIIPKRVKSAATKIMLILEHLNKA